MLDEDQDTLAAEYVLGTLSAEEREHAEALLTFDQVLRRRCGNGNDGLGELNVMVEAVEPPSELWDRIKHAGHAGRAGRRNGCRARSLHDLEEPSPLLVSTYRLGGAGRPEQPERLSGSRNTKRHRPKKRRASSRPNRKKSNAVLTLFVLANASAAGARLTLAVGAIAALLAIYVAAWQTEPNLIPAQLRPVGAGMMARSDGSVRMQQDRLVAVLQQQPTAPAFLVTLDTQQRKLFVRRVSATPEAGKSYELWLISSRLGAPRSLGVVGSEEFTERPLAGNYDVDTLRTASFAVSLEPAGGSKSGAPTGPVLFTGKAVEIAPGLAATQAGENLISRADCLLMDDGKPAA